jgi:hypothetical protein
MILASGTEFLILAILLGLIPASVASRKGYSFLGFWLFGSLLFIVALPVAMLLRRRDEVTIDGATLSR